MHQYVQYVSRRGSREDWRAILVLGKLCKNAVATSSESGAGICSELPLVYRHLRPGVLRDHEMQIEVDV
jgi:hypothetical protein